MKLWSIGFFLTIEFLKANLRQVLYFYMMMVAHFYLRIIIYETEQQLKSRCALKCENRVGMEDEGSKEMHLTSFLSLLTPCAHYAKSTFYVRKFNFKC